MPKYQLQDGNIILADQAFIDAVHPGAVQLPDDPVPALPEIRHITHLAFKLRFPQAKWIAARQAAKVDGNVADFFENYERSKYIDLDSVTLVRNPVMALTMDIFPAEFRLTMDEALAVIDNPVQDSERP